MVKVKDTADLQQEKQVKNNRVHLLDLKLAKFSEQGRLENETRLRR